MLERAGINPVIEGTKIAVVGTGSVGSRVAELLAAAGAGQLGLCDPDTIELRNVRRHLCGVEYLGQAKVLAVRDELKRHGYPTLITPHLGRVQVDGADLTRNMLERCDAVVCCTESAAARQFVNHCAVTSEIPAIVADIQIRNQPLAEAVLVVPGSGGCFNCLRVKWERNGLLEPSESHDGHDYPVETASTPSGLPMHQLTALAAQACDLAALGLYTDAVSMTLLTAIDGVVPGFEDLPLRQPRLEALPKDPSCEVCRGR